MTSDLTSKQNLRVSAGRLIRGDVIVRFATSEEIELHAEIERLQQRVAELEGMNNELSSECLSQFERIHGRKFGAGDVGATPPPVVAYTMEQISYALRHSLYAKVGSRPIDAIIEDLEAALKNGGHHPMSGVTVTKDASR